MDEPATARTRLRSFSPVFPVRDLRRALAHYASLGFDVQPYTEGDGYGFADRDRVSLHLSLDTGHEHETRASDGPTMSTSAPPTSTSRTPTRSTTSGPAPASAG